MWLTSSSVGRKFVMALTGICLVLFVTFHVLMNAVALIWPTAYNQVCEFLGANWYALIASAGLAALFIIHIIYALWLTVQNRKARGTDRYLVTSRPPQVEWSSKNMLVLGIVVLAFLVVHLIQFWAKMQWQELRHAELSVLPQLEGIPVGPAQGTLFIQMAFSCVWTPIIYIIGFIALWFHMNHGFWSMFHSIGWDNNIWIERLKKISLWWTSIVVALFIAQAIVFTVQANNKYYTQDQALQEQYAEYWAEQADNLRQEYNDQISAAMKEAGDDPIKGQDAQLNFAMGYGKTFVEKAAMVDSAFTKMCDKVAMPEEIGILLRTSSQLQNYINFIESQSAAMKAPAAQQEQPQADAEQESANSNN